MLASVLSSALAGVEAYIVEIEIDVGGGMRKTRMVGLPEMSVREALDRIRAALRNSGYQFPQKRATINLAPADTPKEGSAFDLPIAIALLGANGDLGDRAHLRRYLVMGELALDGRVKGIKGALPTAILARREKFAGVMVPAENAREAAVVGGDTEVIGVSTLREALEFFQGIRRLESSTTDVPEIFQNANRYDVDFSGR